MVDESCRIPTGLGIDREDVVSDRRREQVPVFLVALVALLLLPACPNQHVFSTRSATQIPNCTVGQFKGGRAGSGRWVAQYSATKEPAETPRRINTNAQKSFFEYRGDHEMVQQ